MPFDQQDFVVTETNPHEVFSLEGLVWFLERQNPKAEYDYWCNECCLGNYFTSRGHKVVRVGARNIGLRLDGATIDIPLYPGMNNIAASEPRTYGAALDRAKARIALAERQ